MQGRVAVENLEDEQMDCIGGIEQSLPPGVFLPAAGGVDGLFVEVGGHCFSDAAEDANQALMQSHWRGLPRWHDPSSCYVPTTCTKENPPFLLNSSQPVFYV